MTEVYIHHIKSDLLGPQFRLACDEFNIISLSLSIHKLMNEASYGLRN